METKALLYGIVGFLLGGLVVSIAATYEQPQPDHQDSSMTQRQ